MPPFRYRFRVRYGECDAQGVAFNARYADFVDIATNEYIRTVFGSYQNLLDQGLDFQVVGLNLNWKAPARFDEVVEARIEPGHLGNSSFAFRLAFHRHPDDQFLADATITYVMVQAATLEKTPLPSAIRGLLEAGAPGQLVSHAGE